MEKGKKGWNVTVNKTLKLIEIVSYGQRIAMMPIGDMQTEE